MKRISWIESALAGYSRASRALLPSGAAPPPLFYYFLLTYDCDAACPFCYLKTEGPPPPRAFLPAERVREILDQIPPRVLVSFSGGEPLLHPDLFACLEYAARSHPLSLVTNGLGLDEPVARRLAALASKSFGRPGLSVLGISLFESLRGDKGNAAVARKKNLLALIREAKRKAGSRLPIVDVKVVIREDNLERLDSPREWLRDGLADVVTYQLESGFLFLPYHDGRIPALSQAEAWSARRSAQEPRIMDTETLRRQVKNLLRSSEAKEGRIRFYPALTEDEIARYYSGSGLAEPYVCVFPWSSLMVTPLGNACQCRNPRPESLATATLREAWNGENFRAFRVAASRENVASSCAGCCFLKRRYAGFF